MNSVTHKGLALPAFVSHNNYIASRNRADTMTTTALRTALINTILTTRDFCGNERAACLDVFADFGLRFIDAEYRAASFAANNEWRNSQKAAGVPAKHVLW